MRRSVALDPWYKVATPRRGVREGRSFNPDEFAIALEQAVAGAAPEDHRKPDQFFSRTCWTRAQREHAGMVLRRLCGRTDNTAPVLTLITQCGGGKTHTLTAVYHLAKNGDAVAGMTQAPTAAAPSPAEPEPALGGAPAPAPVSPTRTLRLSGAVPPEVWNRLGTRVLPRLRAGTDLRIGVDFSVTVSAEAGSALESELRQICRNWGCSTRFESSRRSAPR